MVLASRAAPVPYESGASLAQRTRVGSWLCLTSIMLFALVDPFVNAHVLGKLYAVKAFQAAVELVVRHTGTGVSQAAAGRLFFEPFFTTERDGLGLHISRSLIEAHGGRVWAAPNPPRGAAFHVVSPAGRGDRRAA